MVAAETGTTFKNVGLNDDNGKSVALSQIDTTKVSSLQDLIHLYQRNLCSKDSHSFRFRQTAPEKNLRAKLPYDDQTETNTDSNKGESAKTDEESVSSEDNGNTASPPPNNTPDTKLAENKGMIGNFYD